jgi:hypothetical protein
LPKDISKAQVRYQEGVTSGDAAAKWARHTAESAGDYATSFGPYLTAQNGCSSEVKHKGVGGFDALVAYAACMRSKFRGG